MGSVCQSHNLTKPSDLFSPLSVLVVDDIPAIRQLLSQMLKQLGVNAPIRQAADGQEAWEALQQHLFDLVVCDINMPRMNGLELLKRLRGHPDYETLPFLMITGEVSEEIVAAAVESEVDGYLLKPFRLAVLEKRLRAIIQSRHHPGPGETLLNEASRRLAADDPESALEILSPLTKPPYKKRAKVLNLLGHCHLARGSPEKAAQYFRQALTLNPYYQPAANTLARLSASGSPPSSLPPSALPP